MTEEDVHWELVLGTHGRSGDQWNIWQAVYSPVGSDGYPKYMWDPMTGEIDHQVAAYWRDHYDLRYILERDWATLGPKLTGKLHLYVGTMDTWHLNNAVYLMEEFLTKAKSPAFSNWRDGKQAANLHELLKGPWRGAGCRPRPRSGSCSTSRPAGAFTTSPAWTRS